MSRLLHKPAAGFHPDARHAETRHRRFARAKLARPNSTRPRFAEPGPLTLLLALSALFSTAALADKTGRAIDPDSGSGFIDGVESPETMVYDRAQVGLRVTYRSTSGLISASVPLAAARHWAEADVSEFGAPAFPMVAAVPSLRSLLDPTAVPAAPMLASSPALAARDSLPDGMPLRVRLLWGDRGLMRGLGLAPETRAGELRLRRSMLQWHQRFGLVTFGALTTQVVLGEFIAKDRIKHADLKPYHKNGAYVTFGLYMTTASLSLFSPPARRYSDGFSSIKLHRRLAILHFAGMMAQPLLGRSLVQARSPEQYDDRLRTHLWVGRLTLGAYTAALLSTFLAY